MEVIVYDKKTDAKNYSKATLKKIYTNIYNERIFDDSIVRMISEGRIAGFYHAGAGQEAIAGAALADMNDDDYLLYMHRGCNEMVAKGIPLNKLYSDFFANVNGTNFGLGAGIIHSAYPPKGVIGQPGTIGSNMPIAVGLGIAIKYRKSQQVVYATFGDGTSARELLHGSFNYAALKKLPVIFMCQNNEYGLGNYYKSDHATTTGYLAEYGTSYGIPSYVVDGNDALAVYDVAKEAIERARAGEGPTFIEAKTFRYNGHFVGDPMVYMDKERQKWFMENNDPINNLRAKMIESGQFTAEEIDALNKELEEFNEAEIEKAASFPLPDEDRLYAGLFSTSPSVVKY